MEVDEQTLPESEVEEANASVEAQLFIKLLEKLAANIEKVDANMEKLTSYIVEIKANQLIIIDLLSYHP